MHPKFAPASEFHSELKTRVEAYFSRSGASPRGGSRLWTKTGTIACWLAASYVALVFIAPTPGMIALAALSLALAIAAVGFNIQHDANHGAFSERAWVNSAMGYALDAIGGSSYVWRFKHDILHHSYTNLAGVDDDIELGALGRLSPAHRHLWFHHFQHLYIWPLYTTVALKWQLLDDFVRVARGRIGPQRFPRQRGWDLVGLIGGKTLPIYTANMFLGAAGFFAYSFFVLFRIDPEQMKIFNQAGYSLFYWIDRGILVPSALWTPLALQMLAYPSTPLWLLIRLVLALSVLSSLALAAALLTLTPRPSSWAYSLAVAGSIFFCLQTVLLDAVSWPAFFSF